MFKGTLILVNKWHETYLWGLVSCYMQHFTAAAAEMINLTVRHNSEFIF